MKKIAIYLTVFLSTLLSPLAVNAADYPQRPVKFVVPWPPGDVEDILTRFIAEEMSEETGNTKRN